jgi:two-component system, NtrC family, sensor kinase
MIDQQFAGLYTLFETLPSGLMLYDRDENIIQMNSRAAELLALRYPDQMKHLKDLPDYLVELRILLQNADEDIPRSEINLILPLRREMSTIGFTLKAIRRDNALAAKIFIFNDITHIVQDRLMMDKIKDELFQSKKLASIGTMISGVAHELNNPLTGISMSNQLIQMNLRAQLRKLNPDQDADLMKMLERMLAELEKIEREAKKASSLVSELLNYSKPTKLNLSLENIQSVITEMVQALKTHPEFAQLRFEIEPWEKDIEVLCDRIKIEQVFYNLFKNASDATGGKGPILVTFSESRDEKNHTHFIVVNVCDTGPGMDKTILSRIFDPFFTTKGAEGVGLGLSISYRTVEQHGGHLTVESEKGEGTIFHVALPIFEEDEILI